MFLPSIQGTFRGIRDLRRAQTILGVLVSYGFGWLVERITPGWRAKKAYPLEEDVTKLTPPQRVRRMMEALGPSFIKLGQMLSSRPDLVPPDYAEEFKHLQAHTTPFPYHQVKEIIQREFNQPVENLFQEFEVKPFSAASISQVHRAVLHSGERVVVKVQRPNIEHLMMSDISIVRRLAELIEKLDLYELSHYNLTGIVDEFEKVTRRELDFTVEGKNGDRFRANFAGNPAVYFPKVFWERTTERVLTVEEIRGQHLSEVTHLLPSEKRTITTQLAQLSLTQLFKHGFFHADPHHGNIFLLPDNVIVLIDFGMTGRIDYMMMDRLADLFLGVMDQDAHMCARVVVEVGDPNGNVEIDHHRLRLDIADMLDRHASGSLDQLNINQIITETLNTIRKYRLKPPPELVLMSRALLTLEGVAHDFYPEFNLFEELIPFAKEIIARRYSPKRLVKNAGYTAYDVSQLLQILPYELRQLLRKFRQGSIRQEIELRDLRKILSELELITTRLVFGMILSALIIGFSLIFASGKISGVLDLFTSIGSIGFLIVTVLGLWLIISILRGGKI
ncbi:MAG: AarF/ABC1/UbiB kinase family protein [Gemmatimonadetes bacterium]|nr:MAG: AarF/ABC1/UbiB kinase family protein [Gemmatimonadota bacterium]